MRLRKQDSAGDMQFGHNAGDFWHDQIEGVGQSIVTRLMLWRGEWFLNRNDGTPWGGFPLNTDAVNRGQILGVHTQLTRDVALRQRVLAGPGVMGIVQYDSQFDPNDRRFSVQMVVDTLYGQLAIETLPDPLRPYFVFNWSALDGGDPL